MCLAGKDRTFSATWQDGVLPLLALPGSLPWLPQAEATLAQVAGVPRRAALAQTHDATLPSTAL